VTAVLHFTDTRLERPSVRDKFDLLLGVVATLEVRFADRLLYREELFPIVELRAELGRWLSGAYHRHENFKFRSMESDEDGLLWLRWVGDGWRIGSTQQEYPEIRTLSDAEVSKLVCNFMQEVDKWVLDNCALHVSSFL